MSTDHDPGTANISTIGSGLDYADPIAWEAATDNDLVTATSGEIGAMREEVSISADLVINGATQSATYFRVLRAEMASDAGGSDQGFVENLGSDGPLLYSSSYAAIKQTGAWNYSCDVVETFAVVHDLGIWASGGKSYGIQCSSGNVNTLLTDIVQKMTGSKNTSSGVDCFTGKLHNVLVHNDSNGGLTWGFQASWGAILESCMVYDAVGGTTGFNEAGGTTNKVNNSVSAGFTTDFSTGWHSDSDYNAGEDTSAPGANSTDNITFSTSVEGVGTDFRAKSGGELDGAGLIRTGFEDDIWNNSRGTSGSACDIGPHEIVASAATPKGPLGHPFHGPFAGPLGA